MTVIQNTVTDPGGQALKYTSVSITLMSGNQLNPGAALAAPLTIRTDSGGNWSTDLPPNQAATFYQVVEGQAISPVVVPATGGPYSLNQVRATPQPAAAANVDVNAADLQPPGTPAPGTTRLVADAGHTHPLQPWQFHVKAYGAKGDGRVVHDGAMTSGGNILTCPTSTPFTAADVGKSVIVRGAGPTGVTCLVTTIAGYTSPGRVTLAANAAASTSATIVFWASDDTPAFQAAETAANTYAQASAFGYAAVTGPPGLYGIFGPLVTGGATLGNAQIPLHIPAATVNKTTLVLETLDGATAATGAHWQQQLFQATGMTLVSGGVFASQGAQSASLTAAGNPCVIGGPTQPNHYGDSSLVFSNLHFVMRGVTIVTPLSGSGWNYCAADLSGISQATIRDVNIGVTATYAANDFNAVANFSGGASKGILMPANGNNDLCDVQNLSVWGGYTWAILATEHTVMRNCRLLYSWAALGLVGSYFNSVGAGHAIYGDQISVEGCTYNWYVFGQGAAGVGPFVDIVQMDTESAAPTCRDDGGGGVQYSLGRIKLTGLYTSASISIPTTGLEVIDGQQRPGPVTATAIPTGTTPLQNPHWRWANVTLAGGAVTAVKVGVYMGGVSAPAMTTLYSQASGVLPLSTWRVPPGGWIEVDCTVTPTTNSWVLD